MYLEPPIAASILPRESGNVRVLLLDDVYVSGSRAQSAAAALRLSGARSVLIVPVGRVLRPERFGAHAAFLAAQPVGEGHRSRCVAAQTRAGSSDEGRKAVVHIGQLLGDLPEPHRIGSAPGSFVGSDNRRGAEQLEEVARPDELA